MRKNLREYLGIYEHVEDEKIEGVDFRRFAHRDSSIHKKRVSDSSRTYYSLRGKA